jgi:SAM-dependent methyltransferase
MEYAPSVRSETGRIRAIQDKHAGGYDRQIALFERVLFGDGREWVCSQARGRVLELACGTARNLPFYPAEVELTGIELSPEMLEIGRSAHGSSVILPTCSWATPRRSSSRTRPSTP